MRAGRWCPYRVMGHPVPCSRCEGSKIDPEAERTNYRGAIPWWCRLCGGRG